MEEIHGIVEIQRQAWNMPDLEIVPTFEMKAVCSFGVVIVAVDHNDKPIGFIYAFPKFPNIHYSHMMATLPEWQGKGVGYEMKKFHRELALKSAYNIETIMWTVDPLLSNNSYLNFTKLGGICKTYYPNYYGDPETIGIYKGLPTDRFLLEWEIKTKRVEKRMKNYRDDEINFNEMESKFLILNRLDPSRRYERLLELPTKENFVVEVPSDFQNLKNENMDIALEWRAKFREICQLSFENNYQVNDFHSFRTDDGRRNFYEFCIRK